MGRGRGAIYDENYKNVVIRIQTFTTFSETERKVGLDIIEYTVIRLLVLRSLKMLTWFSNGKNSMVQNKLR